MPIGKRAIAPASKSLSGFGRVITRVPADRLRRMRDVLEALLVTGQKIADAVREQGLIAVPVTGEDTEPEAGPFVLTGFPLHFVTRNHAGIGHLTYGYQRPNGDGAIDPNAQFHLQALVGQLLAFNLYCQRAEMDEALGVALQAPGVDAKVDAMLVKLAFFAAFFENMLALPETEIISDDMLEAHRANVERRLLIVQDKMFDRSRLDAYLPPVEWPFVGVSLAFEPHADDYFINCVYFPAEHANLLLAAQQMANGRQAQLADITA